LLSHAAPRATLEEVQLRAMRAFVEALRKRKYGSKEAESSKEAERGTTRNAVPTPANASQTQSDPRRRGRHIPVAVRRAVSSRDGHRCTYVDASGNRCAETHRLEFHHVVPFAMCPTHEAANLSLRCRAHNALAAEEDFGREIVDERKHAARHERFGEQVP
jgi:5-methylcytosine-specific restriction endonuclease McrA